MIRDGNNFEETVFKWKNISLFVFGKKTMVINTLDATAPVGVCYTDNSKVLYWIVIHHFLSTCSTIGTLKIDFSFLKKMWYSRMLSYCCWQFFNFFFLFFIFWCEYVYCKTEILKIKRTTNHCVPEKFIDFISLRDIFSLEEIRVCI